MLVRVGVMWLGVIQVEAPEVDFAQAVPPMGWVTKARGLP